MIDFTWAAKSGSQTTRELKLSMTVAHVSWLRLVALCQLMYLSSANVSEVHSPL